MNTGFRRDVERKSVLTRNRYSDGPESQFAFPFAGILKISASRSLVLTLVAPDGAEWRSQVGDSRWLKPL